MPAPFYLGWAVMAVLALGSADMVLRVASNLLRGQPNTEASANSRRHVPRPKTLEPRRPAEGMWF